MVGIKNREQRAIMSFSVLCSLFLVHGSRFAVRSSQFFVRGPHDIRYEEGFIYAKTGFYYPFTA